MQNGRLFVGPYLFCDLLFWVEKCFSALQERKKIWIVKKEIHHDIDLIWANVGTLKDQNFIVEGSAPTHNSRLHPRPPANTWLATLARTNPKIIFLD